MVRTSASNASAASGKKGLVGKGQRGKPLSVTPPSSGEMSGKGKRMTMKSKGGARVKSEVLPEHKKRRRKNGALAAMEMRKLQKSHNLLIARATFQRVVRKSCDRLELAVHLRFTPSSLELVQEAAEAYLTRLMQHAVQCCAHASRKTLMAKDLRLASKLQY